MMMLDSSPSLRMTGGGLFIIITTQPGRRLIGALRMTSGGWSRKSLNSMAVARPVIHPVLRRPGEGGRLGDGGRAGGCRFGHINLCESSCSFCRRQACWQAIFLGPRPSPVASGDCDRGRSRSQGSSHRSRSVSGNGAHELTPRLRAECATIDLFRCEPRRFDRSEYHFCPFPCPPFPCHRFGSAAPVVDQNNRVRR